MTTQKGKISCHVLPELFDEGVVLALVEALMVVIGLVGVVLIVVMGVVVEVEVVLDVVEVVVFVVFAVKISSCFLYYSLQRLVM